MIEYETFTYVFFLIGNFFPMFLIALNLVFSVFDYRRYVVYWLVIFACKFTFAYFLQARCQAHIFIHCLKFRRFNFLSVGF